MARTSGAGIATRTAIAGAAMVLATWASARETGHAPLRAATFAEHQARCNGRNGWSDPAPPVRIFANVYDIGTCGITVPLIAGDKGAIVIDAATAEAVPSILANIAQLGLKPADVKLLLSSHEHADHAGGLELLRRRTGATMVATRAAARALASGAPAADDPQRHGGAPEFRGVAVGRTISDGMTVTLGSLRLVAHSTPGHAPGSTSWSWRSCEATVCHRIVYADSVTAISADTYRFTDHPRYVAAFRASLAAIAALPCDLLVTPHPEASDLYARLAGKAPLASPGACRAYAAAGEAKLNARLAQEAAAPPRR